MADLSQETKMLEALPSMAQKRRATFRIFLMGFAPELFMYLYSAIKVGSMPMLYAIVFMFFGFSFTWFVVWLMRQHKAIKFKPWSMLWLVPIILVSSIAIIVCTRVDYSSRALMMFVFLAFVRSLLSAAMLSSMLFEREVSK